MMAVDTDGHSCLMMTFTLANRHTDHHRYQWTRTTASVSVL